MDIAFFPTMPNPPCPLVPYVAGGSDSTRFYKKVIHSARPFMQKRFYPNKPEPEQKFYHENTKKNIFFYFVISPAP